MRKSRYLWVLYLLVLVLSAWGEDLNEIQEGDEEGSSRDEADYRSYFYLIDHSSPVVEKHPPKGDEPDRPDFIYGGKPNEIRIVEFYANWCPHCRHFRNHYIDFASSTKELATRYNVNVGVYAVSCVPHRDLCHEQGITGYPRIKIFKGESDEGVFISPYKVHPFLVMRESGADIDFLQGDELAYDEEQRIKQEEDAKESPGTPSSVDHFLPRTKQDIYNDAYLSFDFAMKNAIFVGRGPLSNETALVLSDFLRTLQAGLPPVFSLQNMLGDLVRNLPNITQNEESLLEIVEKYPPKKTSWSHACTRGDSLAGYTCGLWELFHIMSVGILEWNDMAVGDDWNYFRPADTAEALRNYIEKFFGCEVCRLNFVHAFDACAYDRCNRLVEEAGEFDDWKEFPMWLFEMHNGVNLRLMRERAEREHRTPTRKDEIAVEWPSRKDCPICWQGDGRWDPDNVYEFLRLTYWPEDEDSVEFRQKLIASKETADVESSMNRILFLVFLALVTFLAAFWYKEKRRLTRTGHHKKVDEPLDP